MEPYRQIFFPGLLRWFVVIPMQILISLILRQVVLVVLAWKLKPFPFSSSSRLIIPITPQRVVYSAMYSALVVLNEIKYCILLSHTIGKPAYIITYPVCKWIDSVLPGER